MTVGRRLVLTLPLALGACGTGVTRLPAAPRVPTATPEPKELILLVASSLTDAFTEMADDFPRLPGMAGVRLTFSFGASSQLRAQLEQGAPADVFATADTVQMDAAVKAGLMQGTPRVFVRNRLVVIVPADNRAGVATPADLARTGLKVVTTPRDVPVGNYTRQALEKMAADPQFGAGFDARVLANVVSEEANVRQVVTKVQLGEADAGIVYASDVTPRVAPDVKTIEIADRFNTIAEYPIGVTKQSKAPVAAQRFVEYVRGAAGQAILKRHKFIALA